MEKCLANILNYCYKYILFFKVRREHYSVSPAINILKACSNKAIIYDRREMVKSNRATGNSWMQLEPVECVSVAHPRVLRMNLNVLGKIGSNNSL